MGGEVGGVGDPPAGAGAGMDLDQLSPVEDPHQVPVGPHRHPGPDQVAGHRVQGLGHFDVVVPVHLGRGVDGQVIDRRGRRKETWCFLDGEQFGGPALGGAVDAQPGPFPTPPLGSALGVGQIDERLPGEHGVPGEGHHPFHSGLVLGMADPGRIDQEPSGLGVLHEGLIEARLGGVGLLDHGGHVVGDDHGEDTAEERPGGLEPGDDRLGGLTERQPHEAVT